MAGEQAWRGLTLAGMQAYDDEAFARHVTARLAELPRVRAVALGGSRATGTHTPDSDWDFAVYYRGTFQPAALRAIGWPGEVSEVGGWGGGVFNGGAWLEVDGRRVDVHYRDLDDVEQRLAEARAGRFAVERLMFHLAGVPTYIVVAELAVNQVLHGDLPHPAYPDALRRTAPERWWSDARATLAYARSAHAVRGHAAETAGAIATAAAQTAHAVLAARGQWVTNEKTLLDRAALRTLDPLLATLPPPPEAIDAATALLTDAVTRL
jgi:predicted nucleotidyltransferase